MYCLALLIFIIPYLLIILYLSSAWLSKSLENIKPELNETEFVSIIVAFRNEENHIKKLIHAINSQTLKNYELILIDDHSDDDSVNIAQKLSANNNKIKLLELDSEKKGKKQAIFFGVQEAKGKYLLFTDADCLPTENWAENMLNYANTTNSDFLSAPVLFVNKSGFWNKLMQLEFISLINLGSTSIIKNRAITCNAANMLVKKETYLHHYQSINQNISSGDDIFLLHSIKQKPGKISFNNSLDALVKTYPPANFKSFVSQRVRWASKSGKYKDFDSIFVGFLTLFANLSVLISFFTAIFIPKFWLCFAIVFLLKTLADFIFVYYPLKKYKLQNLYAFILPLSLIYPFYYLGIGLLSMFFKPKWKDRQISN
ncbi:MAG: glycosyltransferase [Bacteroidales bacterium]|nr:glycosyltransferase [Bacteroidales bacterium]